MRRIAAALLISAIGGAASAASIQVQTFSAAAYDAFVDSTNVIATEDFEGITSDSFVEDDGSGFATSVGTFDTIAGHTGTGSSVLGDGDGITVRDSNGFGRVNTTAGGSYWLDSNDTQGIAFNASAGGSLFDRIAFSLSDAADQGGTLGIFVGGTSMTVSLIDLMNQSNGTVQFVVISFADLISSAAIEIRNHAGVNDGFGIDDVVIAAVPLPAGGLLLIGALGLLAGARRRKA